MDSDTLNTLKNKAEEYYKAELAKTDPAKCRIEGEQKNLIDLLKGMGLDIVDINEVIKSTDGKNDLGDLDIVAYFDQTIIVFEVKNRGSEHMPNLNKFSEFIESPAVQTHITQKYGNKPSTNYKYIFYDANGNSNRHDFLRDSNNYKGPCQLLFKDDYDYFVKISNVELKLARNDLLEYLGIPYNGRTQERTAITFSMDGIKTYLLFISPKDLFECITIPRKRTRATGLSAFQRSIDTKRLQSISEYIKNPNQGFAFPNAIILTSDKALQYTELKETTDSQGTIAVKLNFPMNYGVLKLIDGQHRLLGYSKTQLSTQNEKRFAVVILENLPDSRKAKVFLDINSEFKPVDPNLRLLITHEIDWPEAKKLEIKEKIIVDNILKLLDEGVATEQIIFLGHAGIDKTNSLTLRTMVNSIKKLDIGTKAEEASYNGLKNLVITLKASANSDFWLSNIGLSIFSIIASKYIDNAPESANKLDIKGLLSKLDTLPKDKLTIPGYGIGGARARATELISMLKEKFSNEFDIAGFV